MNPDGIFRPATREDTRELAELVAIASGGVVEYVWDTLAPEYPGLTPVEIGAARYAREDGDLSYRNCTVAEQDGKVVGVLHAYTMDAEPEAEDHGPVDPILEPYAGLEVPGSYYVRAMAVFPEHRGEGLGTRMLENGQRSGTRTRVPAGEPAGLRAERGRRQALRAERIRRRGKGPRGAERVHPLHGRRPADGGRCLIRTLPTNPGFRKKTGRHPQQRAEI